MRGMDEMQEALFTTVKLEDFVPADHPLRPIRLLVNQALKRLNGLFSIIYADSGSMAYAEGQTDLSLRLYDGSIHQYRPEEPTRFQLTYFSVNDIRVKNVYDQLQRNTGESIRGDREMSTCEMLRVIRDARQEQAEARRDRTSLPSRPRSPGSLYCSSRVHRWSTSADFQSR